MYSNFRNKDELCTAVLGEIRAERLGEVLEIIARPDTLVGRHWKSSSRCTHVAIRQLRTDLAGSLNNILQMLTAGVESAENPDLKMPGDEIATAMVALGVGLGLLRSIDPAIGVNGLIDTLRLLTGQPF